MEVLIYSVLIGIWWILSFTALLPFVISLILSKTVRDKWFAFIFSKLGSADDMYPDFSLKRKGLFTQLEKQLSYRDKSVPLKVLEIGIGIGANLQFYPQNSRLTVLDMNPSFIQHFNKNKAKYPHVNLDGVVIGFVENMKDIDDAAFDLVICTHVLCSVQNTDLAIKEVKRVLKPEGKFLFIEHVAFPKGKTEYLVQMFAAPLWYTYFCGCWLNRDTDNSIQKAGFSDIHCDNNYLPFLPLFTRHHIFGIATK